MKKCKYCGKKLNDNFEFCNSKCENCYEKMMDKDSHKIKYFILGIILGFVVMFYGIISNNNVFIIGIGIIVPLEEEAPVGTSLLTNHFNSTGAAVPRGTTMEVMKKKKFCSWTICSIRSI